MDITFTTTPKLEALRLEVRAWLDDELPPEFEGFQWDFEEDPDRWAFYRQFWKKQGAQRWLEPTWPREYGGAEMSARQARIIQEEFDRRRAGGFAGIGMQVGPAILRLGTDEQKTAFLPGMAAGEIMWAEGYTEPERGFGPRVAAHACGARRRRVGDRRSEDVLHRRSSLQLVHHRGAHRSRHVEAAQGHQLLPCPDAVAGHRAAAAARTSPTVARTSCSSTASASRGTACSATSNQGWQQVWFGLGGNPIPTFDDDDPGPEEEYEPGPTGHAWVLDQLVQYCQKTTPGGDAARRRPRRPHAARRPRHRRGGREDAAVRGQCDYGFHLHQAITKEFQPEFAQTCMEILGPLGQIQTGEWAPLAGEIDRIYRRSFGNHAGGTSQVKRMVVATRVLGLPR